MFCSIAAPTPPPTTTQLAYSRHSTTPRPNKLRNILSKPITHRVHRQRERLPPNLPIASARRETFEHDAHHSAAGALVDRALRFIASESSLADYYVPLV